MYSFPNLEPVCCSMSDYLPFFMDLTFQVPMQIALSASAFTSITSHILNWVLFSLWLHLFILSGVISSLISSSILGIYRPGKFIFQCPIFLPFHTGHGILKARILKWLPFPSPVDHILSELSTKSHPSWVALHGMTHCFMELDKAMVHVIRLVSFLWLWFQSVCPLMPSLSTYRLTGVSLTLDVGYLFTAAPAQCSHCSLLGCRVSPLGCSPLQGHAAAARYIGVF